MSYRSGKIPRDRRRRNDQQDSSLSLSAPPNITLSSYSPKEKIEFKKDTITGVYDENLNIHKIHHQIVQNLKQIDQKEVQVIKEKKDKLEQDLQEMIENYDPSELSPDKIISIADQIEKCDHKIESIENNDILKRYLNQVTSLLEKFDECLEQHFEQESQQEVQQEKKQISRIIDQYIHVTSSNFFPLFLSKQTKPKKDVCDICSASLSGIDCNGSSLTCPDCGKVHQRMIKYYQNDPNNSYIEKTNEVNSENVKNFEKAIQHFDLRADTSQLPDDEKIIKKLDAYFKKNSPEAHRDSVQGNGFDRWIRKGTSVAIMEQAMRECGFNHYYDHLYYFCKVYWGWKRPGIEHLEETLVEEFKMSRPSYNLHKGSRNSSMNVNYELYYGLKRHGFNIRFNDLKMIKTESTLSEYEQIRQKVDRDMGWSS